MLIKNKKDETIELRVRSFPKISKGKVNAYRRIMHQADGGRAKPSFRAALVEIIDFAYKELAVKRIENDSSTEEAVE